MHMEMSHPAEADSYQFDPQKNKNIVVCCDGTWNTPEQQDRGKDAPTNVYKFYAAIDCEALDDEPVQLAWYDAGVGAELGIAGRLLSFVGRLLASYVPGLEKLGPLAEGATGLGVAENIREAYRWLCRVYAPGDRIFLVGFSRGAFQVRSLAGLIHSVGLLKSHAHNYAPVAFASYRNIRHTRLKESEATGNSADARVFDSTALDRALFHDAKALKIRFLGVWDTVAGLGLPMWGWSFELFRIRTSYHKTTVVPIVEHVYHAVAMDEQRSSFMPVLLKKPDDFSGVFEQQWFRGAHADVGGGYSDTRLSDIALQWMMDNAAKAGLRLSTNSPHKVAPDPMGALHDEVASNRAYVMTGLWPRMFPVPEHLLDDLRRRRGANTVPEEDVGQWHRSVSRRQQLVNKGGDRGRVKRLALVADKDDPALWDRAEPDPRELEWTLVPAEDDAGLIFTVYAERIWSPTGAILVEGEQYEVQEVVGGAEHDAGLNQWFDLSDPTDANGKSSLYTLYQTVRDARYLSKLWAWLFAVRFWFAPAKRLPGARWFQLIGMINQPTHWERKVLPPLKLLYFLLVRDPEELLERQIPLGKHVTFVAKASGPFYCYANDLWVASGNNSGALTMRIRHRPRDERSSAQPNRQDAHGAPAQALARFNGEALLANLQLCFYGLLAVGVFGLLFSAVAIFLLAAGGVLWPAIKDSAAPAQSLVSLDEVICWIESKAQALAHPIAEFVKAYPTITWGVVIIITLAIAQRLLRLVLDRFRGVEVDRTESRRRDRRQS